MNGAIFVRLPVRLGLEDISHLASQTPVPWLRVLGSQRLSLVSAFLWSRSRQRRPAADVNPYEWKGDLS